MNIGRDVRYALRSMIKAPGFTAVAVLTLGLGIGANTAIFTVINAVFLRAIPVRNPERLMSIFTSDQRNSALGAYLPVSYPNADDIRRQSQSFSGIALRSTTGVSMTVDGQPQRFAAEIVSGNFFDVLGVPARLGRTFRPEEDRELGSGPVVVLSYGLWERKFGSDHRVIGETVLLNGQGFTVIGVAPRGFQGTGVLGGPDLWVPMSMHDQIFTGFQKFYFNERRFLGFFVVGRLKDGVSEAQARSELLAMGSNLQTAYPIPNKDRTFTLVPLLQSTIDPNQRSLFTRAGNIMMAVVGLVLLIACVNVANLLLARSSGRKREVSIRLALGASRAQIIAQLLTESVILAVVGAGLGVGLAIIGRNVLWQFRPPFLQQAQLDLSLDINVLLFTLFVAIGSGIVFGLAPALQASRPDLISELKERAGGEVFTGRRFRIRDLFVVVEVALSLVALIGAGMFLISLHNAQKVDPGFNADHLAMLSFDLGSLNYEPARVKEFQRRTLEAVQGVPAVESATLAANVPLLGGAFARSVFPEGQGENTTRNGILSSIDAISPQYLQTMGIPLMRGDTFDDSLLEEGLKVAIINQAAASRFWPGEDPIGKRFKFFGQNEWHEVIGVARDSKYNTLGEEPTPYIYLPLVQDRRAAVTLFFRTTADPKTTINAVRTTVQMLDRNLPLTNVWPIGQVIDQALWAPRFGAGLLTIFALIAVVLCAVGIYGVVGYSVGLNLRQIGIRLALGAQPRDVLLMVLRQSATMMGIGLAIGVTASIALVGLITSLLYGVNGNTPITVTVLAAFLALVGLIASYFPARQASAVDPLVVLRKE